jgi:hypothetical protein
MATSSDGSPLKQPAVSVMYSEKRKQERRDQ